MLASRLAGSGADPARSPGHRRFGGFARIELTIVGILTAIALPSYLESLRKGNRADAKAILMETSQYMERYFTTNNSYCDLASPRAPLATVSSKGVTGGDVEYTIDISVAPTGLASYLRRPGPGVSMRSDEKCGTLTRSNTGVQKVGQSRHRRGGLLVADRLLSKRRNECVNLAIGATE
jgi:type IV pilus assembly protein PilE